MSSEGDDIQSLENTEHVHRMRHIVQSLENQRICTHYTVMRSEGAEIESYKKQKMSVQAGL